MMKKRALHAYCVEFSSFKPPGYSRHGCAEFDTIRVQVMAAGVDEARHVACRETLTQFIPSKPKSVSNVCWSKDATYPEAGYISVQYPRGAKLSRPYHMTKRMKIEVTLGNIPIQLSFDFGV